MQSVLRPYSKKKKTRGAKYRTTRRHPERMQTWLDRGADGQDFVVCNEFAGKWRSQVAAAIEVAPSRDAPLIERLRFGDITFSAVRDIVVYAGSSPPFGQRYVEDLLAVFPRAKFIEVDGDSKLDEHASIGSLKVCPTGREAVDRDPSARFECIDLEDAGTAPAAGVVFPRSRMAEIRLEGPVSRLLLVLAQLGPCEQMTLCGTAPSRRYYGTAKSAVDALESATDRDADLLGCVAKAVASSSRVSVEDVALNERGALALVKIQPVELDLAAVSQDFAASQLSPMSRLRALSLYVDGGGTAETRARSLHGAYAGAQLSELVALAEGLPELRLFSWKVRFPANQKLLVAPLAALACHPSLCRVALYWEGRGALNMGHYGSIFKATSCLLAATPDWAIEQRGTFSIVFVRNPETRKLHAAHWLAAVKAAAASLSRRQSKLAALPTDLVAEIFEAASQPYAHMHGEPGSGARFFRAFLSAACKLRSGKRRREEEENYVF